MTKKRTLKEFARETAPPPPGGSGVLRLGDRGDGWAVFGAVADTHLGSKHERLDVLKELYDLFISEGVTDVYHAGNWIEGESSFNKLDLRVFGLDNQMAYFVENYPARKGLTTYIVSGDDHEGWYQQREALNIGRHMENTARAAGRSDLRHLGYVEADVALRRGKSEAVMRVMHGGGGSSYAISYRPQKIIESFTGGEKPQVLILGHYHKQFYSRIRNVHVILPGCTQDQTIFMRKKSIEAAVGGAVVYIKQSRDGSVMDFVPRFQTHFDRGYYERRFE